MIIFEFCFVLGLRSFVICFCQSSLCWFRVLFCFGFALVRNLLQRVLTLLVSSSGMEAQQQQEKWTGGVELTLSCPVESAWAVQSDFLGLHKWAPNVLLCEPLEGENKKVGCLRHCVGTGTTWVHERLLQFDDDNMYMSYRMEQNNFVFPKGFQGYHSTVQVHNSCSPHPPPPPFFILDLQFLRFFRFLPTSKSLQLFPNFQVSSAFSNFPIFFSFLNFQVSSAFSNFQVSSAFSNFCLHLSPPISFLQALRFHLYFFQFPEV